MSMSPATSTPFLSDVKALRDQARRSLEDGAVVAETYLGDPKQTVEILQSVLATELVCVLRYTQHSIVASGINSSAAKAEFAEHARQEQEHAQWVAERITQLGGTPDFNPDTLTGRSASQFAAGADLVDMIKENLIAERIAVAHYQELIRFFGDNDPTTRVLIERVLEVEEEHADDMHDLLVAHEGRPMLGDGG